MSATSVELDVRSHSLSWLLLAAFLASGCVVEERAVVARPAACRGGRWVPGHYGPRGRWHPGHWRCPNVVEVVEVD